MTVRFVVPGRPVPKQRPRVYSHGKRVQVYTPPETRAYEETVALFARRACQEPFTGPVRLRVRVYLRDGRRCPDLSNLVKSIEDGMNGTVFEDDRQVRAIEAWLLIDDDERAEVEVEPIEEGDPCRLSPTSNASSGSASCGSGSRTRAGSATACRRALRAGRPGPEAM